MTAKEYLQQAFTLHRLIKAKESQIQSLRDMQVRIGQMSIGIKVQTSTPHDPMGDITVRLLDIIAGYQNDIAALVAIQGEMAALIDASCQGNHRIVLYERYINLKRWLDIAADNGKGNWAYVRKAVESLLAKNVLTVAAHEQHEANRAAKKAVPSQPVAKANRFCNFEQRNTDYGQYEKLERAYLAQKLE